MAVNLSCLQLEDPTLVEYLAQTLREEGVSAEHIIVELTESYLAPNLERLSGLLAQMRGLGLRVAMDDFGTGYSSLSVLKHADGLRSPGHLYGHPDLHPCRSAGVQHHYSGFGVNAEHLGFRQGSRAISHGLLPVSQNGLQQAQGAFHCRPCICVLGYGLFHVGEDGSGELDGRLLQPLNAVIGGFDVCHRLNQAFLTIT